MTEPVDPYQNENSSFSGSGERPEGSASPREVLAVGDRGLGGKQVWTLGPGGERHYYAHLDSWADGLQRLDRLRGHFLGLTIRCAHRKCTVVKLPCVKRHAAPARFAHREP